MTNGILVLQAYELKVLKKALTVFLNSYDGDEFEYSDAKRLREDIDKILRNNLKVYKGGSEL